jgi:hypothetical protein
LLAAGEKDSSMLHLYLPEIGLRHSACWGTCCTLFARARRFWAFHQLVIKCIARSHTVWSESVMLSHTWLFFRFQILHTMMLNSSCWALSSLCRTKNRLSAILLFTFTPALT